MYTLNTPVWIFSGIAQQWHPLKGIKYLKRALKKFLN